MIVLILLATALGAADRPLGLMPMPAKLTPGTGRLPIDADFAVGASGHVDAQLRAAIARLRERIARQTGLPILPDASGRPVLVIDCQRAAPPVPALGEDESYVLEVTTDGARLSAPTVTGALRGMATFSQLVSADAESFYVPAVRIEDHPRFAWRGLMLDVARHWMPVAVVERNLEAMAAVKLNVFHWHLSDDQGFRVESKRFPELQRKGSDGYYYTQDEIRHIVEFAHDRGIRVVPEFDIPGHTDSWLVGYPELASAPGPYSIGRRWGIYEPVLDPSNKKVYDFLNTFLGEMAQLFPDAYFHIGGDEVRDTQWKANPKIQAFAAAQGLKSSHELQQYFNRRIQAILKKHGKKMVGWDEIFQPGLPTDIVIQSWRGQESLADAATQGYNGILSWGYYLDHLSPASLHYANDPLGGKAASLDAAQSKRVLGGEACMWSEYVTAEDVDSRIWPRTAAIAERLWSPKEITDVDSMYARLEMASRGLEWTGVQHRAYTRPALERLAAGGDVGALETLADAVEADRLNLYRRHRFTSRDALNRLVDAVPPESEPVRRLEGEIKSLATASPSSAAVASVRSTLTAWRDNHKQLLPTLEGSFLLKEAIPLSENLSKVGRIGLEALGYIEGRQKAPEGWAKQQTDALAELEKPSADVTLAAARAVRLLVEQAGSVQ